MSEHDFDRLDQIEPKDLDKAEAKIVPQRLRIPYGYSAPVEHGGRCLECGNTDGSHWKHCAAVD